MTVVSDERFNQRALRVIRHGARTNVPPNRVKVTSVETQDCYPPCHALGHAFSAVARDPSPPGTAKVYDPFRANDDTSTRGFHPQWDVPESSPCQLVQGMNGAGGGSMEGCGQLLKRRDGRRLHRRDGAHRGAEPLGPPLQLARHPPRDGTRPRRPRDLEDRRSRGLRSPRWAAALTSPGARQRLAP
jgi:hypothetical protein